MPLTRASFSFSVRPRSYCGKGMTRTPEASTTARWASLTTAWTSFLRAPDLPRNTSSGRSKSPTYSRWSKLRLEARATADLMSSRWVACAFAMVTAVPHGTPCRAHREAGDAPRYCARACIRGSVLHGELARPETPSAGVSAQAGGQHLVQIRCLFPPRQTNQTRHRQSGRRPTGAGWSREQEIQAAGQVGRQSDKGRGHVRDHHDAAHSRGARAVELDGQIEIFHRTADEKQPVSARNALFHASAGRRHGLTV